MQLSSPYLAGTVHYRQSSLPGRSIILRQYNWPYVHRCPSQDVLEMTVNAEAVQSADQDALLCVLSLAAYAH